MYESTCMLMRFLLRRRSASWSSKYGFCVRVVRSGYQGVELGGYVEEKNERRRWTRRADVGWEGTSLKAGSNARRSAMRPCTGACCKRFLSFPAPLGVTLVCFPWRTAFSKFKPVPVAPATICRETWISGMCECSVMVPTGI